MVLRSTSRNSKESEGFFSSLTTYYVVPTYLSVCLSVRLSVCLSIHLYLRSRHCKRCRETGPRPVKNALARHAVPC